VLNLSCIIRKTIYCKTWTHLLCQPEVVFQVGRHHRQKHRQHFLTDIDDVWWEFEKKRCRGANSFKRSESYRPLVCHLLCGQFQVQACISMCMCRSMFTLLFQIWNCPINEMYTLNGKGYCYRIIMWCYDLQKPATCKHT
jgi:hypothetical protein